MLKISGGGLTLSGGEPMLQLDDIIIWFDEGQALQVSDDAMRASIRDLLRYTGNLAEGAGAAGLAGLRVLAPELVGKRVGIAICGGNLSLAELARTMAAA